MTLLPRGVRRPTAAWVVAAGLLAAALCASPARAQLVKPWVPPSADSVLAWSAEARARFRENLGDSVGGTNYDAYERVGRIGRLLLHSLGRANLIQAQAIEAVIDSLGLDTEVATDPRSPEFVLLMVHNPFRAKADAVGWLFWFRQSDLRVQGIQ